MDGPAAVIAAVIGGGGAVLGALVTGYFTKGAVAEQLKTGKEKQDATDARIKALEAIVTPMQTVFSIAELHKLPEKIVRLETKIDEALSTAKSIESSLSRLVTKDELAGVRRELSQRLSLLEREHRSSRRRIDRHAGDITACLVTLDMNDRLAERERIEREDAAEESREDADSARFGVSSSDNIERDFGRRG